MLHPALHFLFNFLFNFLFKFACFAGSALVRGQVVGIVVAMSSIQNVVAALSGGMVAILGGALAVVLGFLLIPVLSPHHSSEQKMAGKVALNEGKQ